MATTGRRFWVEVLPRFAVPADPPVVEGAVPRLTALAVAAGLDGAELDAELASVHRQRSSLAAYELGLIERKAALGARQPLPFAPVARTGAVSDLLDEEEALQAADDFVPEEVAMLLGTSVPSTRHHVDYALTLVRQLPAVWHALADQRIDESHARAIVRALKHQAASAGGPVDDGIVDALAGCGVGWAERGCGPSALHDRLLAALIAADPAAADRRREVTKRGADAVVVPTGDGLGELRLLHVDVADLKLARAQVDAHAKVMKADGDERPIGQIRIAVVLALIMRPWEARDPAVAHLTVNADLADLLLPDLEHLVTGGRTGGGHDADADESSDGEAGDGEVGDGEAPDGRARDAGEGDAAEHGDTGTGAIGENGRDVALGVAVGDAGEGRAIQAGGGNELATDTARPRAQGTGLPGTRGTAVPGADGTGPPGTEGPAVRGAEGTGVPDTEGTAVPGGGAQVGAVDELPVSPAAIKELLRRIDALGLTPPAGGHLAFTITGPGHQLLAVATPDELEAAARTGRGIGPPPATPAYRPTSAQYRYLRARDRHCRFPGCRHTALHADVDHVVPYDHTDPARGGQTSIGNLVMLCRRHHRLKTHAPHWAFAIDPDGALHVTTPGGTTRSTRPPAAGEVLDLLDPAPPPHDPVADPPAF